MKRYTADEIRGARQRTRPSKSMLPIPDALKPRVPKEKPPHYPNPPLRAEDRARLRYSMPLCNSCGGPTAIRGIQQRNGCPFIEVGCFTQPNHQHYLVPALTKAFKPIGGHHATT